MLNVKQLKTNKMKTIKIKVANNQITTVILDKRIDANMFSCKSSSRKRNADLLVHIDNILTDVSEVSFEEAIYTNSNTQNVMSQDEFDGLCQANQIGENPFKCTIMCSNPVDYSWIDVNDLIKGETYINPNSGDEFIFNRYEITDKNKFAVDTDGAIHISGRFRK